MDGTIVNTSIAPSGPDACVHSNEHHQIRVPRKHLNQSVTVFIFVHQRSTAHLQCVQRKRKKLPVHKLFYISIQNDEQKL